MRASPIVLLLAAQSPQTLALRVASLEASWRARLPPLQEYSFQQFLTDFGRDYLMNSSEYNLRMELFESSKREMLSHNEKQLPWRAGVSKFMDWTAAEKKRVYGYKGRGSGKGLAAPQTMALSRSTIELPNDFSVVTKFGKESATQLLGVVRDQGNCGSCWAEAATATLEGQLEVNETLMKEIAELRANDSSVPTTPTLSSQTILSCTQNPRNCGGKGGCDGATVELAYTMLQGKGGLPFAVDWSYHSGTTGLAPTCQEAVFSHHRIHITGYTVLPQNKLLPLQEALVTTGGPIAVSVDASNWFSYSEGVFSDRWPEWKGDFQVNHAVTLMGYKRPTKEDYGWWRIKNSWGNYWGESGYIRIELKEDEETHCGTDYNTHEGLACDGDPDTATVCGTCGILYDSAYPTGLHLNRGVPRTAKSAQTEAAFEKVAAEKPSPAEVGLSQVDLTGKKSP